MALAFLNAYLIRSKLLRPAASLNSGAFSRL
jgi:hypothetical protein